jgi:hypothetical protein
MGTVVVSRLRRRLIVVGVIAAVLGTALALGLYVLYPALGRRAVSRKLAALEARLGQPIEVGSIEVRLGHAVLRDVRVLGPGGSHPPVVTVERVDIDFATAASLVGVARLGVVVADGVHVELVRDAAGVDNVSAMVERWRARRAGAGAGTGGRGTRPSRLVVRGLTGRARDLGTGTEATVGDGLIEVGADGAGRAILRTLAASSGIGPTASAATVTIERAVGASPVIRVEGGQVAPYPRLALTGIAGSIIAADTAGAFDLDLAGGYGGVEGTLWTANGRVVPASRSGVLDLTADRFSLDRLEPILRDSPLIDYQRTSVDAALHVEVEPTTARFSGGFHLHGLTVGHPMLADKPVHDLDVEAELAGVYDAPQRRLTLERGDLVSRGLPLAITGEVGLRGGKTGPDTRRAQPVLSAHLVIPPVPCQQVLAAIPTEMAPYLAGYRMTGTFATDLQLGIDWANLAATILDGSVGIRGCKVVAEPGDGPGRLRHEFEHFVEVERGNWISFMVGPSNPDFVSLSEVSPYLVRSLMTTEDSAFYQHRGFIVREFRSALIRNLEAGYFRYGASSITMQLVKNVLLYREKTLARKLQELFLTWHIENVLEKDRILEIYVNAIEYGPGLYGIGPAAQHYFGKHPRDLGPVEAAFFSSILPAPKQRYKQYCEGTLSRWTTDKIARILSLMHKRGRLTDEELAQAQATPLVFARDPGESEKQCMDRRARAIKKARPTNPMKK